MIKEVTAIINERISTENRVKAPNRETRKVHTSSSVFSLKNESLYFDFTFFQKVCCFFLFIIFSIIVLYRLQIISMICNHLTTTNLQI